MSDAPRDHSRPADGQAETPQVEEIKIANDPVVDQVGRFDSCKASLIHRIFPELPTAEVKLWRRVGPFAVTLLTTLILPTVVAVWLLPETLRISTTLKVPYFRDWNTLFMYGVSLPLIVTLLRTERQLVPSRLKRLFTAKILFATDHRLRDVLKDWVGIYARWNLRIQLLAVVAAAVAACGNWLTMSAPGFAGWQVTSGQLNVPGKIFLFWQIPIFAFVITVYIGRAVLTTAFLKAVVAVSTIKLRALDPDNAAGLSAIGRIGLRNQFVLAVVGLNLVLGIAVAAAYGDFSAMEYLVAACSVAYVIGGPVVFMGPLMPFRRAMLDAKQDQLRKVADAITKKYESILSNLGEDESSFTKEHDEELKRLQGLRELIAKTPVWPFDMGTLRRFLSAYLLPFLALVLPSTVAEIVKLLAGAFG